MGSETPYTQVLQSIPPLNSCLVLNSRQSRRPCARDKWVEATSQAITSLVSADYLFLTSIGQNSWELIVHLVNRLGGRQVIVLPQYLNELGFSSIAGIISDFRLQPDRSSFFILKSPDIAAWQKARDEFLAAHAGMIVPSSVRPNGNLARIIAARSEIVNCSFRTEYSRPIDLVRYDWKNLMLNPEIEAEWNYLTHWTRSSQRPFAAQDRYTFYDSILTSPEFPGSALNSLVHVLKEKRIRASERFIRGAFPVVSLTSLRPAEALPLMRWRKRYGYYSFEPYGIAIRRSTVESLGCREVSYGSVDDYNRMEESDRPYFQNAGSEVADWRPEAEWRHWGDIDLSQMNAADIKVITYLPTEATLLRELCPYSVLSICSV